MSIPLYVDVAKDGGESDVELEDALAEWKDDSAVTRSEYNTLVELLEGGSEDDGIEIYLKCGVCVGQEYVR